ncbi:voltage-gated chloride channel family protein [Leptospira bouyouniensis]|nr:voltage-gated chloride channel family protein [Leptospira bouyouniensis]
MKIPKGMYAKIHRHLINIEQGPIFFYVIRWTFVSLLVGVFAGSASAIFLKSLDFVTNYRENNLWIIYLLPIAGLAIGLLYHYFGQTVIKGNNQLIEEIHNPKKIVPLRMAPLVLLGTIITHLFGGSAGREGTAVQMGGAVADQLTYIFRFRPRDRKILIICGISAGFSSVFGTPLAGAVFGLEVYVLGRLRYDAIFPSLLSAILADFFCKFWNVGHTDYSQLIQIVPELSLFLLVVSIFVGILFGLTGMSFGMLTHFFTKQFRNIIPYPPLRPFIGGVLIVLFFILTTSTRYLGLGVPIIVQSFSEPIPIYDFLIKMFSTSFTLGAGFKGGEVTPLFFIGSTLGSSLSEILPLPRSLMAGMGFVGVFAAAANTPLACTFMAIELFGINSAIYMGITCVTAYLFSGHTGIYSSQVIGDPKHLILGKEVGQKLSEKKKMKNLKIKKR